MGILSNLDVFVGSGYVVVVLSNYGQTAAGIFEGIRALVLQTEG